MAFPLRHILVVLLLLWSVPAPSDAAAQARCEGATLPEAKAMARKAAELLRVAGPGGAFPRFADPEDEFIDRDLYVFVIDLEGRSWFNARFLSPPGQNMIGSRDAQGRYFVKAMIETAMKDGEGWVEYDWISPCSGLMEPKSTYVVRVGPVLVGVGAYGAVRL